MTADIREIGGEQSSLPGNGLHRGKRPVRKTRRGLLSDYLLDQGYQKVAALTLAGPSGTTVNLDSGVVHGREWDPEGRLVGLYWIGKGSLSEGFTVPADTWTYLDRNAEIAWILLLGSIGTINAYPFDRLRLEVDLYPAGYRVRLSEPNGDPHAFDEVAGGQNT